MTLFAKLSRDCHRESFARTPADEMVLSWRPAGQTERANPNVVNVSARPTFEFLHGRHFPFLLQGDIDRIHSQQRVLPVQ
jgi:hypothetical protein